jgi:DNA-binding NarL/FixJ family response regulator
VSALSSGGSRISSDLREIPEREALSGVSACGMGTRVLIVDDHAAFRRHVGRLLVRGGYEVVGEAADCAEAIAQARRLSPAVVLLDVMLPDGSGLAVASELARAKGAPAVVLTSSRSRADLGAALDDTGAAAFIPKDAFSISAFAAALEGT